VASVSWYLTAFLLGLAGSLHCIGMCGPIFLLSSSFYASPAEYLKPMALQHAGKMIAYGILGLIMAVVGRGLSIIWYQNVIMIITGTVLIIMALFGIINFKFTKQFGDWLSLKMQLLLRNRKGSFLLGFFNGLIPCGLVYAAAVSAMASNGEIQGFFFMVFFGLGTAPALSIVAFSRWSVKMKTIKKIKLWRQIPVVFIGIWFLFKGLELGIPFLSPDYHSHQVSKNCCQKHQIKQ
jgi:sulfite exporter TauE/SafE